MKASTCIRCFQPLNGADVCKYCGFDHAAYQPLAHTLPVNTVLHERYTVGAVLGEGGFGITYAGFDASLSRRIAIKEYFPGSAVRDAATGTFVNSRTTREQHEIFENGKTKCILEAKSLAQLDDIDAVVRVLDFFEENNTAYIIMEYVEGVTLSAYAKTHVGAMEEKDVISLLLPVMMALETVHQRGFVHRDISPDNLMLTGSGEVKLLDFGAVKAVTDAAGDATSHPMIKRGFSGIELYTTTGKIGPWSDVYSMSGTMYYLLTGKIPAEPVERMNNDQIASAMAGKVGPQLQAVLLKGLAVRPEERYRSMGALAEAIGSCSADAGKTSKNSRKKQEKKAVAAAEDTPTQSVLSPTLPRTAGDFPAEPSTELQMEQTLPGAQHAPPRMPGEAFYGADDERRGSASASQTDHANDNNDEKPKKKRRLLFSIPLLALFVGVICFFVFGGGHQTNDPSASQNNTPQKTESGFQTGSVIYFGAYPQTRVTDSALIASLESLPKTWTSYAYFSGTGNELDGKMAAGDYMRFADVTLNGEAYRAVTFDSYRPYYTGLAAAKTGGYSWQDDNGYQTGKTYYFRFEPLAWRVLDPAAGLVCSEKLIDSQPYQNTVSLAQDAYWADAKHTVPANDYEKSSIRLWVLNVFYQTAFSAEEQKEIGSTALDNSAYNSASAQYNSAATTDAVFLLSYADLQNPAYGFSSDKDAKDPARRTEGTDYARCQGLSISEKAETKGGSYWWLRSPGFSSVVATRVAPDYSIGCSGYVCSTGRGIRPAFCFANGIVNSRRGNTEE